MIRPQSDEFHDYRGYAGRVAGGVFRKGDRVVGCSSGFATTIEAIDGYKEELKEILSTQCQSPFVWLMILISAAAI
ncbi:MAG: hypothetical protein R2759_06190 [Bacteroidales bacterium]